VRLLLQRVNEASVTVEQLKVAEIGAGLLVFVGVEPNDTSLQVTKLVDKTLGLRIFADDNKPMNRSVVDLAGELLVVSQFTLAADTSKGKRPGFSTAAPPALAEQLFDEFVASMRASYARVQQGVFGADMQVALVNDGPVTFVLDA
jgi:D-tyrosyl-tRNA(Tyr) deacylase